MSDDLIERLHEQRPEDKQAWWRASEGRYVIPLMLEAAAELEAARKRIGALEKAQQAYKDMIKRQRERAEAEIEAARKQMQSDYARIDELLAELAAEGCMRERAVADVIYVTRRAERAEQRVAELEDKHRQAAQLALNRRLQLERAESELAAVRVDAERLDWMQARLRGASDSERYLPFRIYWGKGGDIRKVIDAARAKEQ